MNVRNEYLIGSLDGINFSDDAEDNSTQFDFTDFKPLVEIFGIDFDPDKFSFNRDTVFDTSKAIHPGNTDYTISTRKFEIKDDPWLKDDRVTTPNNEPSTRSVETDDSKNTETQDYDNNKEETDTGNGNAKPPEANSQETSGDGGSRYSNAGVETEQRRIKETLAAMSPEERKVAKEKADTYTAAIEKEVDQIREYNARVPELMEKAEKLGKMEDYERKEFLADIANFQLLVKRNKLNLPRVNTLAHMNNIVNTAYRNIEKDDKPSKVLLRPWLKDHPGFEEFKNVAKKEDSSSSSGETASSSGSGENTETEATEATGDSTVADIDAEYQILGKAISFEDALNLSRTAALEGGSVEDALAVALTAANRRDSSRWNPDGKLSITDIVFAPNQYVVNAGLSRATSLDDIKLNDAQRERFDAVMEALRNPELFKPIMEKLQDRTSFRSADSTGQDGVQLFGAGTNRYGYT